MTSGWLIEDMRDDVLRIEYLFEDLSFESHPRLSLTVRVFYRFRESECKKSIALPKRIEKDDLQNAYSSRKFGLLPFKLALKRDVLNEVYSKLISG